MVDSINIEVAGFPHLITIHYVGVGHRASFPRDNFSPSLTREGRLKHWRIGSLGAHLSQKHLFIHLTDINQVLSLCQALGWEPGPQQGSGQTHTQLLGTYRLARETKILMCVLSCDMKSCLSVPQGLWYWWAHPWQAQNQWWLMTMMMIMMTCIFYLKRWGHSLLSPPFREC